MTRRIASLCLLLCLQACTQGANTPEGAMARRAVPPRLPDDAAGALLGRAIKASGGWEAWARHRDASFLSTLTMLDSRGVPTSETIFLHKTLLHQGHKSRLESVGLDEEIVFGLDGEAWWMLRDGALVRDERSTAFTHFAARNGDFWFRVPFLFAEEEAKLAYLGMDADGDRHWEKLRVDFSANARVPVAWVVAYVNTESGLVDRMLCELRDSFLRQELWRAELSDFRWVDGILRERRREFFPVNDIDRLLGTKAAQEIVEHIRFNNDFPPTLFEPPVVGEGERTAA